MEPHGTPANRPTEPASGPLSPFERRRKRRSARRTRAGVRWLAGSLVVIAAFAAIMLSGPRQEQTIEPGKAGAASAVQVAAPTRPIYRHSVIPGGVYSSAELIAAADSDPVVFARYGSVSRTAVRTSTVASPRRAYMSYRIGDAIYWTKGKLVLNAGEMTLTNGDVEIRARCGNQISETAMTPTSGAEPDAVEFDRLVAGEPGTLASTRLPGAFGAVVPGAVDAVAGGLSGGAAPPAALVTGAPESSGDLMVFSQPSSPFFLGPAGTTSPGRGSPESPTTGKPGQSFVPDDDIPPVPPPTAGGTSPDHAAPETPTTTTPTPPPGLVVPPGHDAPPTDLVPPADFEVGTVTPIPEPGTIVLLGTALTGLAAMIVRKRRLARRLSHRSPPV